MSTGMALPISYRNPAVMTCRALLLLCSMCPEMHEAGRQPEKVSWDRAAGRVHYPVLRRL